MNAAVQAPFAKFNPNIGRHQLVHDEANDRSQPIVGLLRIIGGFGRTLSFKGNEAFTVAAPMRNRGGPFSVGRLMEFLTALGQDVKITVKPTRKAVGEMEVVGG